MSDKEKTDRQDTGKLIFIAAIGGSIATFALFFITRVFQEYDTQLLARTIAGVVGIIAYAVVSTKLFNMFFIVDNRVAELSVRESFARYGVMSIVSLFAGLGTWIIIERLITFLAG